MNYEIHDFYCLNCGRPVVLPRKTGHQHKKLHRKKIYCPWCKNICNHIEISNVEQKEKFLKDFENGIYKEEALASINYERCDI